MARLPRFDLASIAQHVVQRGYDRRPYFARDVDHQHSTRLPKVEG